MELFRTEVLLGRIVRLRNHAGNLKREVLELCCSEWFQNLKSSASSMSAVLELCCSEWFQNRLNEEEHELLVLELCCSEWFQNSLLSLSPAT